MSCYPLAGAGSGLTWQGLGLAGGGLRDERAGGGGGDADGAAPDAESQRALQVP